MAVKLPEIFCDKCRSECVQNTKTIDKHIIVWCQECELQWLKGDDQKVSSKLPEKEAKRLLELRASQLDRWGQMWKDVNNDALWEGDTDD